MLTGLRQSGFQVVRCPHCGSERFILPRSPLTVISESYARASSAPRASKILLWLLPLVSVMLTGGALVLAYWLFLAAPSRPAAEDVVSKKSAVERLEQARHYLADGMFRLAADELSGDAADLPQEQKGTWRQLKREAAMLADLCSEPLEDIVRHAAGVPEREWQAEFLRRYRGKAIVFDTIVRQTPKRTLQWSYVFPGPGKVHLDADGVDLLRKLSVEQPRRVLFGVRLESVRLKPPGNLWEVRFEPDSGVLLTDAKAAGLCCPALNEPDAVRILEEQAKLATQ